MEQFFNAEEKSKIEQLMSLGLTEASAKEVITEQRKLAVINEQRKEEIKNVPDIAITSFETLKSYSNGHIVKLPDFCDGQPFVAKIRRPSMMKLAKEGKIPNVLLSAANDLFAGSSMDVDNPDMLKEFGEVCYIICDAALISPTLAEIEKAGVELTDEQMIAIFNYSQAGAKSLETFR